MSMANQAIKAVIVLLLLLFLQNTFLGMSKTFSSIASSLIILFEIIIPIYVIEKNHESLKKFHIYAHNIECLLDNFLKPKEKRIKIDFKKIKEDLILTLKISSITIIPYVILFGMVSFFMTENFNFKLSYKKFLPIEILIQLIVVALPEEFFYRGFLQNSLKQKWPTEKIYFGFLSKSVIITNIFFALSHVVGAFSFFKLLTFFPGLIFSYLSIKTKSIFSPIVFHALCNIVGQVLFYSFYI